MKRLLFVIDGFYLAGAETFMYELVSNLQIKADEVFDIEVIYLRSPTKKDYYFSKYLELGVKFSLIPFYDTQYPLVLRIKHRLFNGFNIQRKNEEKLKKKISESDLIVFNQLYVLNRCKSLIPADKNVAMHLMGHLFQRSPDQYKRYERHPNIHFTYFCHKQKSELIEALSNPKTEFFPLIRTISLSTKKILDDKKIPVIATVSRISKTRALDNFLYACHIMHRKKFDFKFIFIGGIQEEEYHTHLVRMSKLLFIDDKIVFHGQSTNLKETLEELGVDLLFSGPMYTHLGYGSIESIAHGFPTVFWKMDEHVDTGAHPSFSDINDFSNYAISLFNEPDKLRDLISKQQEAIKPNLEVDKAINFIENFYRKLMK